MPIKKTRKPSKGKRLDDLMDAAMPTHKRPKKSASKKPNFYEKVYAIVEQIPLGKVTTYGAIAETLGMKGSSRMVGHALGAMPEDSDLPAQRVINRVGALSGAHHFGGYDRMRAMLKKEGITFKAEIVDMEVHFWHPKAITEQYRKKKG